jgi:hypothetical protein
MPSADKRKRKGRQRQAVIPLRAREGETTMTEKKNQSSMSMFPNDVYASWRTNMKQMMASYLDTNEKLAKETLGWYEKATAWAKDTPWAPLFKTQISSASKVLEGSTSITRKLWQIEKSGETPEETQEA